MLGLTSARVQVLESGMFVLDGFHFDESIPLIVFNNLQELVREITVFEVFDNSVQLRICKREDSYADLTGCVLHPDSANTGLVAPFMQALQAIEQFLLTSDGLGCGVKVKFQSSSPKVGTPIIRRRLEQGFRALKRVRMTS